MAVTAASVAIPGIPPGTDPGLRKFLEAVKEAVEVRTNQRGSALDSSPTFQDLIDAGLISLRDGVTIGGQALSASQLLGLITTTVPDWVTSDTAPPAPVGLTVTPNTANTVLSWTLSTFDQYGSTEIWRASSNNLSAAVLVGSATGKTYPDELPPSGAVYYYWIRDVSLNGLPGPFNAVPGTATAAGPGAVASLTYGFNGEYVELAWPVPTSNLSIQFYELRHSGDGYASAITISASTYRQRVDWVGNRTFHILAIDINGNYGSSTSATVTVTAPDAPGITLNQIVGTKLSLVWSSPGSGSLPIRRYELRYGASFAAGTLVSQVDGTSYRVPIDWTGGRTFWLAAIDTAGNYGTATSYTCTIAAPSAPAGSGGFLYDQGFVSWVPPSSSLPLDFYEVRYGTDFATGTSLGKTYSTRMQFPAQWSGTRSFFIAAYDVNGNLGAAGQVDLVVTPAPAPTISKIDVIDNNVLLYWPQVSGSLPTLTYEWRRGSTWSGATVIGRKSGGFTTVFETAAGTYTYWVAAVDSAGNYGTPASATATVSQPPDYILKTNYNTTFAGTKSNMGLDLDGSYLLPMNITETWQTHFTGRGWAGPQDQVTAGYAIFAQPSNSPGYYEEVYDYGATLAASKITVTANIQAIIGAPAVQVDITTALDAGFTSGVLTFTNTTQAYATNFRYIKFRVTVTAAAATDFSRLIGINVRLDSKVKTITGMVSCLSTDSGGTIVYLTDDRTSGGTKTFVDVDAIQTTPLYNATYPGASAVYDFTDSPNPLSMKVLMFDNAGIRISGTASYTVRGF